MTTFIGDVHQKEKFIHPGYFATDNIQIGDLHETSYRWANFHAPRYFIEGNHDHMPSLKPYAKKPYQVHGNLWHIPRGFFWDGVLFIGGGNSLDIERRQEGINWFPEEAPPYSLFRHLMYREDIMGKVNVIVSHECPNVISNSFMARHPFNKKGIDVARALENVFEHFSPKLWIFGHHHQEFHAFYRGCEFICLAEGQKIEVDIGMRPLEESLNV